MSVDEKDLRMMVVAFEDVATWCETLANLTDEWLDAARSGRTVGGAVLEQTAHQLAETRRYLESNRREVGRIRERTGIA